VQEQLRARYATGGGHQNARNIQVRIAPDPQLAVCKGVVADRIRKLRAGTSVLSYRCCRASYGTICKELYNKDNPQHAGRATILDSMNGKPYVTQSIAWFIIKVWTHWHTFERHARCWASSRASRSLLINQLCIILPGNCNLGTQERHFPPVSWSHMLKNPSCLTIWVPVGIDNFSRHLCICLQAPRIDAQILCEVQSDLSAADEKNFKRKYRHFWTAGKTYLRVDYQVRVLIGPADILFELCE